MLKTIYYGIVEFRQKKLQLIERKPIENSNNS
jgi:hypothetical protein